MDYLFRWLELRFLSGTQLALIALSDNHGGLAPDPGRWCRFRPKDLKLVTRRPAVFAAL